MGVAGSGVGPLKEPVVAPAVMWEVEPGCPRARSSLRWTLPASVGPSNARLGGGMGCYNLFHEVHSRRPRGSPGVAAVLRAVLCVRGGEELRGGWFGEARKEESDVVPGLLMTGCRGAVRVPM